MLKTNNKFYKRPASRCRFDPVYREQFYRDVQNLYRFTDGIYNCSYLGKLFSISAAYARAILLECPFCSAINERRRYRRKSHPLKRFMLADLAVQLWTKDPDNTYIDDIALMLNIPVASAQTFLNKRPEAPIEEITLKRPLSVDSDTAFYLRNGWKDQEGNWTPSKKVVGWCLVEELRKQTRTFNEFPWPTSADQIHQALAELRAGVPAAQVMSKYAIPSYLDLYGYFKIANREQNRTVTA